MNTRPLACWLALAVAGARLDAVAAQRAPAGFVVEASGPWTIAAPDGQTRTAARSAELEDGDELRKPAEPAAYVIVALYTGTSARYDSTTIVRRQPAESALERIMRAIQQRFQSGVISTSVRGADDFRDAVVTESSGGVNLEEVFTNAPAGVYVIDARPVVDGRVSTEVRTHRRVHATTDRAPLFAPLEPGVFQLDIAGEGTGVAGEPWIRVVPAASYRDVSSMYARLASAGPGAGPELRRAAHETARGYLLVVDDLAHAR